MGDFPNAGLCVACEPNTPFACCCCCCCCCRCCCSFCFCFANNTKSSAFIAPPAGKTLCSLDFVPVDVVGIIVVVAAILPLSEEKASSVVVVVVKGGDGVT